MKQKVVVIGHGYTSRLGVIRALGREGYEVTVIAMTGYSKGGSLNNTKPIDGYSKYVSRILYCLSEEDFLINLLLTECVVCDEKPVLFPCSDFAAITIDNNRETLAPHFLFPYFLSPNQCIGQWMNKEKQKKLAKELGIRVANAVSIDVSKGTFEIPDIIRYPCFTKTRSYLKGTKQTLQKCDNKKQLREFINNLSLNNDFTLLVEDYMPIETEYAVLGFSDGKEVVIPGVIQIIQLAHDGHFGVACTGKIMPVHGFEDLIAKFKKFLLQVGFVGVFDIDFYKSAGEFYFCELNLRIGGSCSAVTKMGVNLPVMMVKSLLGDKLNGLKTAVDDNAVYVNERMLIDDWNSGYVTTKEYHKIMDSADISFIKDDSDRKPYVEYQKLFIKRWLKKKIRKIFRI